MSTAVTSRLGFSSLKQRGGGIAKETALRSAKSTAKMCHSAQASAWSEQWPIIEILLDFFAYGTKWSSSKQANFNENQNRQMSLTNSKPFDIKIHLQIFNNWKITHELLSNNCFMLISTSCQVAEDKNVSIIKWRNFRKVFLDNLDLRLNLHLRGKGRGV